MLVLAVLIPIFLIVFFIKGLKVVRQSEVMIIERFGRFKEVIGPGLNFIMPLIDASKSVYLEKTKTDSSGKIYNYVTLTDRIDLREQIYILPEEIYITKDNKDISVTGNIYFQIVDPKSVAYQVQNLPGAIEVLSKATIRNIVEELDLEEAFSAREIIKEKLKIILVEATPKWGIEIKRIEIDRIKRIES